MTGFRVSDVRIDFARCWVPQTTSTWQARKSGTEPTGRDGVRGELGLDVVWIKGFALRVIGMRERLTIACYPRRLKRKWTGDEELAKRAAATESFGQASSRRPAAGPTTLSSRDISTSSFLKKVRVTRNDRRQHAATTPVACKGFGCTRR